MGRYYKNRIMISKKESDSNFTFDDFEKIKNTFVEISKSRDIFEYDIETIQKLLDFDEITKKGNNNSVVIGYDCFSELLNFEKNFYMEFIFKYMDYSVECTELKKKLGKKYNLEIISNETYTSNPQNLTYIFNKQYELENTVNRLKNILMDIVKDESISDDVIKKIVSSNDIDIIKSSVRNKNISDETLDLILNQKI